MRVLRGRAATPAANRELIAAELARTADTGEPAVRVYAPRRQVAFGRRDTRSDGFERARRAAVTRGFEPVERDVGGRAVAYSGATLAFAVVVPVEDVRSGLADRYDTATGTVVDALTGLGGDVVRGEPDASFCPGDHSVRVAGGGKIAGIAQRVTAGAALVAGCLIVSAADETELAGVLEPVYDALDAPFSAGAVGSVAGAGGPGDPERVARTLESAFLDGVWGVGDPQVERIGPEPFERSR